MPPVGPRAPVLALEVRSWTTRPAALLEAHGVGGLRTGEEYPTGRDWCERLSRPSRGDAARCAPRLRLGARVDCGRPAGYDKMKSGRPGEGAVPASSSGRRMAGRRPSCARGVIDASGTWRRPEPDGVERRARLRESGRSRSGSSTASGTPRASTGSATRAAGPGDGAAATRPSMRSWISMKLGRGVPARRSLWAIRRRDWVRSSAAGKMTGSLPGAPWARGCAGSSRRVASGW